MKIVTKGLQFAMQQFQIRIKFGARTMNMIVKKCAKNAPNLEA